MATFEQLPGRLDLKFKAGDYFSTETDFSVSLAAYTVEAKIVSLLTETLVATIATTFIDQASGILNLSMSSSVTAAIAPGTYLWRLSWVATGAQKRTALEGYVEVL